MGAGKTKDGVSQETIALVKTSDAVASTTVQMMKRR